MVSVARAERGGRVTIEGVDEVVEFRTIDKSFEEFIYCKNTGT